MPRITQQDIEQYLRTGQAVADILPILQRHDPAYQARSALGYNAPPAGGLLSAKPEEAGFWGTLGEGARSTGRALGGAANVLTGDDVALAEKAQVQAEPSANPFLSAFYESITQRTQALGEDPGLLESIGEVGGAILDNPKGAAYAVLEQVPNAAAVLAPAWAGMKGGALAGGAVAGPVGAAAGGVLGGLAGMFLGNTALETGFRGIEAGADGQLTDEERSQVLQEGAVKGAVLTGVDALTLGASKFVTGATVRAVEQATKRTLIDSGVDVTNAVALKAAQQTPEIVQAVRQAQEAAMATTQRLKPKLARGAMALGLETTGEGLGEYLGELAATGKADMADAVLESFLSLGQSAVEVAYGAALNRGQAKRLSSFGLLEQARQQAAEQGGDALAQELAAAGALPAPRTLALPTPDAVLYGDSQGNLNPIGPNINVDGTVQPARQGQVWVNPRNNPAVSGGPGMDQATPRGAPAPLEGLLIRGAARQPGEQRQSETLEHQPSRALPSPLPRLSDGREDAILVDSQGAAVLGKRGNVPPPPYVQGGRGMDQQARGALLVGAGQLDAAAHAAATSPLNDLPEPSLAQKEAGNYKKGHLSVLGLDLAIENPRGSERSGKRPDGSEWRRTMSDHYGYIKRTEGADGDQVDVYLGENPDSGKVFVVDQLDQQSGGFDEHKVMLGFKSRPQAVKAYRDNFDAGWKVGPVTELSIDEFKQWLKEGDTQKPLVKPAAKVRPGPRRRIDRDRDSLVQAVIRLGGLRTEWRQDTTGEARGNRQVPGVGALWSDKTGTSIDDMASLLDQHGYVPAGEMDNLGGVPWLQAALGDELAGRKTHHAPGSARQESELAQQEAERFGAQADSLPGDDLEAKLEAAFDLRDDIASLTEDLEALELRRLAAERHAAELDELFGDTDGPDTQAAGAGGADSGAEPTEASAEPTEADADRGGRGAGGAERRARAEAPQDFALSQQTEAEREAAERTNEQAQREAAAQARTETDRAQADRDRNDFLLTGSDRPADVGAARGQNDMFAPKTRGELKAEQQRSLPKPVESQPQSLADQLADMSATGLQKPASEKKPKAEKIEDFGERLEGARKFATYTQKLQDATDLDVSAVPLSKSWPQPDYAELLSQGADPWGVAFMRAARDEIPSKPGKGYKLKRWVEQVETLRGMAIKASQDAEFAARVRQKATTEFDGLQGLIGRADLYAEFGHAVPLKGINFTSRYYSIYRGEENVTKWVVDKASRATALGNWPQELGVGNTREEALAAFAKAHAKMAATPETDVGPAIRFDVFSRRGGKGYFIGKKNGSRVVQLKEVGSLAEARAVIKDGYAELEAQYLALKDAPPVRGSENAPRVGADYRNGLDVTPVLFNETFGFRGVQFGNYVENKRRAKDLNDAFDGLMDLAGILNLPPRSLSLNGELGLAFGARGHGGPDPASAHYERDSIVINLTKAKGAGSLAHEWWHSLDNYLSRARKQPLDYLTAKPYERGDGVRPELVAAYKELMSTVGRTRLKQRSEELDKLRTKDYWSTPEEMTARAFESYVIAKLQDSGISSDYLANVVSEAGYGLEESYPYPTAAEIPAIRAAYDNIFSVIETREDEAGNIALREEDGRYTGAIRELSGYGQVDEREASNVQSRKRDYGPVPGQGLLDLYAAAGVPEQTARQQAADSFNVRYVQAEVGQLRSGFDRVTTPEQVAHLIAPIRKHAQETVMAVVTGPDGQVLNVIRHSKGAKASSSLEKIELAGAIASTEGAANVWLAHHHPSGDPARSMADLTVTRALEQAIEGTGIALQGHVIVAPGGQAEFFSTAEPYGAGITITPAARLKRIPVTERVLRKRGTLGSAIDGPDSARDAVIAASAKDAILLLGTKHHVVGVIAMSASEMKTLREGGRVNRLLKAFDATNADAAIIKTDDREAAANVARFLSNAGARVLDWFTSNGASTVARGDGESVIKATGAFYRLTDGRAPGIPLFSAKAIVKNIRDQLGVRIEAVADEASLPQAVRRQIEREGVPGRVAGIYHGGTSYLIASNLRDAKHAVSTVLHEAIGHAGVKAVLGDRLGKVMQGIYRDMPADLRRKLRKRYAGQLRGKPPAKQHEIIAEEYVAHMAEQDPRNRLIGRLVALVRRFIRQVFGERAALKWTRGDIVQLLAEARRASANQADDPGPGEPMTAEVRYSLNGGATTREEFRKLGLSSGDADGLVSKLRGLAERDWRAMLRELSERAEEGLFDGLVGIKRALEAVGATDAGYVSARMASGLADILHAVMHYGAPEWRDGIIQARAKTRGLLDVLGDLGADQLTDWLGWLGGKRAQLLMRQGREHNLSAKEIDELLALAKGREALFERTYREYAKLNEAVLDVAQEAGLIKPEQRAQWLTDYYVPFYRQLEGDGLFSAPRSKRGLSHQTAAIRALKGGKLPTQDLLANMLAGWTKRIDASLKNKALLEVVDGLKGSDYLSDESLRWQRLVVPRAEVVKKIKGDRVALEYWAEQLGLDETANHLEVAHELNTLSSEGYEELWGRVAPTDPDIIRVQRGGKSEYYRVNDASLLRGVKAMAGSTFNDPVTRTGRWFKRLLTTGVTASPDFIARNFIRDAAHAWMINKDGFRFGLDSVKGLAQALKEDPDYQALMFAGGSFQGGYVHGTDPEASAQIIRRALEKKGLTGAQRDAYLRSRITSPAQLGHALLRGWEKYRELGDKVENANRLATYKAALAAGKSKRQAAFEAKDLMDYSLRGNFAALLWFTDVVPFLNARMQGLYKLGRAMKGDKSLIAKEVAVKGAYLALFSLVLAGLNDDDERYQELPDWDKDTNWHVFLGVEHYRIPKPFELGLLFGTVPERMFHLGSGTQGWDQFGWSLAHGITETLAFNPVPQAINPIREVQANRNFFFDTPIESMADEGKLAEARYDERTSLTMRALGTVSGPLADLSPKQLQHLWEGYTGTLGAYALWVADQLVAPSMAGRGERPARDASDLPVLRGFYRGDRPRSTQYHTDLYDMLTEVDQLARTVKAYRNEGLLEEAEQLLHGSRDKLRHRRALGFARKQLGAIRKRMQVVHRDPQMSGEQKRLELDRLQLRSNELAERIVKRMQGDF